MTFVYNFYLPDFISEINYLITFLKFLSFVHMISKLSILFYYAEYLKKLMSYYVLLLFIKALTNLFLNLIKACLSLEIKNVPN